MSTNRFCLPFLHVLINQSCNMSCLGCGTISDESWSGYASWKSGREWLERWAQRMEFERIGIVGGEPFINPDLSQWIKGTREMFPDCRIQVTTNGTLLHKRMDIVDLMDQIGNSILKISRHLPDENCDWALDQIQKRFVWQEVEEYGIKRLITGSGFRLDARSRPAGLPYKEKNLFIKTYDGDHANMRPYNNDPQAAYDACWENASPVLTLHQGRLYKCMTTALRREELDKFHRPNWAEWKPLLDEQPGLEPTAGEQELSQLFENIGRPADFCRQCPTQDQEATFFDHSVTVSWKKSHRGIRNENQTHQ